MGGGREAFQAARGPVELVGGQPRGEPPRCRQARAGLRGRLAPQLRRGRPLLPGRSCPRSAQAKLCDQG
eukprot:14176443-Alexandrium_andersonii.AAC.1